MKHILYAFAIAVGLTLQGCGSVVVPTLAALGTVSPLTADPAGFEVAVDMPDGTDIAHNGATIVLSMSRSDTGEERNETYTLQRRESTDGRLLFRVDPADLDAVRDYQTTANVWETEESDATSGSLSVGVTACSIDDGPADDAHFSVWIRTVEGGPFMPLIKNAAVSDVLDETETLEDSPQTTHCE